MIASVDSKHSLNGAVSSGVVRGSARAPAAGLERFPISARLLITELLPVNLLLCTILVLAVVDFFSIQIPVLLHWALSGLALIVATMMLMRTARHLRFVAELRAMLRRISSGEPLTRLYFEHAHSIEDRSLALAFSEAQKSLSRRLKSAEEERRRVESTIASMAEGVLGIDMQERILRLNPAAAELLHLPSDDMLGRSIQEVLRSAELQKFVTAVLQGHNPEEIEITIDAGRERALRVSGRELVSEEGTKVGAIIVMSDITRLRKLERARSDFIANVSHELKTPVTSIQGFAETLLDGALDNPEDARKFLGIICRQAERLGEIFDEMLVLSRLEQEEQIELAATELKPIIEAAVQSCSHRAVLKQAQIEIDCPSHLSAPCHAALLEQAISNLVDNAVKYSPLGSRVLVMAASQPEGITISVRDNGPGIESQHLPRIFERFYRVDKGRSRAEGGTGLGLAIVKHIAQAHGGQALVESSPGQGSTFTIQFNPLTDKGHSDNRTHEED